MANTALSTVLGPTLRYSGGNYELNYYSASFVNAGLTAGVLTVTHSLTRRCPPVTVIDNNGVRVMPDSVSYPTTGTCSIDLSSYGTISGTWYVEVM